MEENIQKGILIAFGELFLKSEGVKRVFQKKLIRDLQFFFRKARIDFKIHQFRDRLFIVLPETIKSAKIIERISGTSWFAECLYFPKAGLKEIGSFIDKNYKNWIKRGETFAIRLKKPGKAGPCPSLKTGKDGIIERIARNINRKVDLDNPKKEIFVEVRKEGYFIYFKKQKGLGGFPAGSSGKVLTLMSGGIDSPVAGYLISKKGAENIWLHFHSFPLVSNASVEKVKELAEVFLGYQHRLKIYFLPFQKAQIEIKSKIPAEYRILLYRRLMFKIAELIAKKEKCKALITGESLGQVSSQTLPNLGIIEEAIKIPVLRPLISADKEEIIAIAKKINTYNISIKPQEDCCTLFTPKHPTAEGKMETAKQLEKKLNTKKLIKDIIKEAKIVIQ
jgi:thiamine biosynthesis protein ThiI